MPGLLVELYSGHYCVFACNNGGHRCVLRWPPLCRYNGQLLNLAPRFRALHAHRIDPDTTCDWLCAQITPNDPKNAHYLPVLAPRMILQDAPNNDFHVWGPCARSGAPPPCPSQARERRRSAAGDPGVGGHMRFTAAFDPGDATRHPPRPPGHQCLGVSDFPAAEEVYEIVHTPPGGRPGS